MTTKESLSDLFYNALEKMTLKNAGVTNDHTKYAEEQLKAAFDKMVASNMDDDHEPTFWFVTTEKRWADGFENWFYSNHHVDSGDNADYDDEFKENLDEYDYVVKDKGIPSGSKDDLKAYQLEFKSKD